MQQVINNKISLCLLSLIFYANAQAITSNAPPSEPKAPAMFNAGTAECHQEKNNSTVCTYHKDAQFIDQDTKLWAPTIIVYRDAHNTTTQIQALGDSNNQAHYQGIINPENTDSRTTKNAVPVNATANTITIYPPKNLMTLEGQATIIRNQDTITGAYLEYDTAKQTILAAPKEKTNAPTTIIFHPPHKNNVAP